MDDKIKKRAFEQTMDIWINPEIEIRKRKGWLKDNFELKRAQIIFNPKKRPKIRFNEDVKITAEAELNRSVIKGEEVKYEDLKTIKRFIVDYPRDLGHITIFHFLDRWIFIFDAKYNKMKIQDFIIASKEFYESAKENLEKNRLRPFFENCWASAELSSACHSLSLGEEYARFHEDNLKKFKNWSELGNVDKKHSDILIRLDKLRKSARYMHSDEFKNETPEDFLNVVKKMIEEAEKLTK